MRQAQTYPKKLLRWRNLLLEGLQEGYDILSRILLGNSLLQSPQTGLELTLIHSELLENRCSVEGLPLLLQTMPVHDLDD